MADGHSVDSREIKERECRELTEHTVVHTRRLGGHMTIVGLVVLTLHAGVLYIGLDAVVME